MLPRIKSQNLELENCIEDGARKIAESVKAKITATRTPEFSHFELSYQCLLKMELLRNKESISIVVESHKAVTQKELGLVNLMLSGI